MAGTDPGDAVADVLAGLGGAPARPGVVHVVCGGRRDLGQGPSDPATLTLRSAVLAATVDHVVVDPAASRAVVALARQDATVEERQLARSSGDLPAGSVLLVLADDWSSDRGRVVAGLVHDTGREVEVVPGVGYVRAAATAAGVAVGDPSPVRGEDPVAFETGDLTGLAERLVTQGYDGGTPVLVIEWAGRPRQTVTPATVSALPAVAQRGGVVVVVGTHDRVPWRDRLPLAGVSVLVPRSRHQASALSMRIRSLGGEAVEAPTITIEPGDLAAMDAAARELASGRFVAVGLTSPNGVDALADAVARVGLDGRALAAAETVAAVGSGTARRLWERLRIHADLVPGTSTSAALGAAFPSGDGDVLLPRADIATEMLAVALRDRGYSPVEVTAYVTGTPDGFDPDVLRRLANGDIDLVALASSSTARNFAMLMDGRAWEAAVVSIGPVTSATCAEVGMAVAVEADPHDLDGLVAALCQASPQHG